MSTGPVEVAPDNAFAALGLPERLVERLARDGITEPFPIQAAAIPDGLTGRDVLGRGRTGSGKTLAFGLPTVTRLAADAPSSAPRRPRPSCSCRPASWPCRCRTRWSRSST